MSETTPDERRRLVAELLVEAGSEHARAAPPVWLIKERDGAPDVAGPHYRDFAPRDRAWLRAVGFTAEPRSQALLPGPAEGEIGGVALGLGNGRSGDPSGPSELLCGQLGASLPPGLYRLAGDVAHPALAALAFGLGAYRFGRYKTAGAATARAPAGSVRLVMPDGVDRAAILDQIEAVWWGRDLINTPASDMGPAEIEAAVRALGARHGAVVTSIVGDALIENNFPLIHAVGRASPCAPRLIELNWGQEGHPQVTLVGKGISFDTGGLDIKPSAAMLIMKKDMGGAAAALATGHMIMGARLNVRLRLLVPAAENSISGNAFRPGDVIASRAGRSVEIGNTDAEGRLVLADALSLADADAPGRIITFATLTGAARVALGPDLPALFTDDEAFASTLVATGAAIGDPVWRLPLWPGYDCHLESEVADMSNVWEAPFAGAITAALFLKRFVTKAASFAHLDLYGWRTGPRPLGPKGGEPQTARAVFETLALYETLGILAKDARR